MTQSIWQHQALLPPDPASAATVREFVCRGLSDHDLPHLIDDVRLAASELATNAVLHARQPFTVSLRGDDCLVVLSVRDSSRRSPVQGAAQETDTHGRGLAIVEAVSHDWGVHRGTGTAKSVWASFEVTPDCDSRRPTG
jgi:anti-sigma regulatory factor (Ser/Thr protein kinase)